MCTKVVQTTSEMTKHRQAVMVRGRHRALSGPSLLLSSAAVPVNSQSSCADIPATRPASDVHVPKAARPPRHYRERNDILEPVIVTGNRGYAYHSRYTCPNLRTAKRTHTQCLRPMPSEKVTRLARFVCTEVYGSLG